MNSKKSTPRYKFLKTKDKRKKILKAARGMTSYLWGTTTHMTANFASETMKTKGSDMFSSVGRKDLSSPILHPESNLQKQTGKSRPFVTSRQNERMADGGSLRREEILDHQERRNLRTSGRKNNEKCLKN